MIYQSTFNEVGLQAIHDMTCIHNKQITKSKSSIIASVADSGRSTLSSFGLHVMYQFDNVSISVLWFLNAVIVRYLFLVFTQLNS
jgi:hypothetical protein